MKLRWPSTFRAEWMTPRFGRLLGASVLSDFGSSFAEIAIVFAVIQATGSASSVGLVLAAYVGALVLFLLPGGVAADHFSRTLLMFLSDIVRVASQGLTAFLLFTSDPSLLTLCALQAVTGAGEAFFRPASTAVVPEVVSPRHLQTANGALSSLVRAGGITGYAVAGVVVASLGPASALVIDAATFAISAMLVVGIRSDHSVAADERTSSLAALREGWAEFRSRGWVVIMVAEAALSHIFYLAPILVLGPLIAADHLGGAATWGFIAAAFHVGLLLGAVVGARRRPRLPLVSVSRALFLQVPAPLCLGVVAVSVDPPLALAITIPALTLAGISHGYYGVLWDTTVHLKIPEDVRGRVVAYDHVSSQVSLPIGFAAVGPTVALVGIMPVMSVAAAWAAVSALTLLALGPIRGVTADQRGQ